MTDDTLPAAAQTGPAAILIGPMGTGKTTVGRALAGLLAVPFADTDELIEAAQGRTISDIFIEDGERLFRDLEREAVARAVAGHRGVLALGGGAPMDEATQAVLTGHRVVFLDVGIADAAKRIGFDRSRPLLALNPRATWVKMMTARRPVYASVAAVRVDTAGRSADEVATEIAAWVTGRPPAGAQLGEVQLGEVQPGERPQEGMDD